MTSSDTRGRFLGHLAGSLAVGAAVAATGCDSTGLRVQSATSLYDLEHGSAAFGDPRTHPISLSWLMGQLALGRWREGYARLVEVAGQEPRIGWQAGRRWHVDLSASPSASASEPDTGVQSLLADLLGATLVDAQDELWAAWDALERAGHPEPAGKWLTEPPPWPPASIEKYLRRDGENAMALIETLAAELAPEPMARGWLIRSWLAPARLVDETLLAELARAAEGRLGREPRFRSWLRAEWTAWARQRYRRVARLAATTRSTETAR